MDLSLPPLFLVVYFSSWTSACFASLSHNPSLIYFFTTGTYSHDSMLMKTELQKKQRTLITKKYFTDFGLIFPWGWRSSPPALGEKKRKIGLSHIMCLLIRQPATFHWLSLWGAFQKDEFCNTSGIYFFLQRVSWSKVAGCPLRMSIGIHESMLIIFLCCLGGEKRAPQGKRAHLWGFMMCSLLTSQALAWKGKGTQQISHVHV